MLVLPFFVPLFIIFSIFVLPKMFIDAFKEAFKDKENDKK